MIFTFGLRLSAFLVLTLAVVIGYLLIQPPFAQPLWYHNFADQRTPYYQALNKPLDPDTFMTGLQRQMQQALERLDTGMPHNSGVKILQRPQGCGVRDQPSRLPGRGVPG